MTRQHCALVFMFCASLAGRAMPAAAQPASRAEIDAQIDARLKQQWDAYLAEAAADAGLTVTARRLNGTHAQKVSVYTTVVERLKDDRELRKLVTRTYVQSLV